MNEEIIDMMYIYNTFKFDWMGDEIKNPSDLTRHHIIKKQYDAKDDISNYALLTTSSHHLIHYLEVNDNSEYNVINNLFLELNQSKKEPTDEYFSQMRSILKMVKKDIKNNKRGRNKKRK